MIQFFRRIRQKLLANNQMKKYVLYAIGEIALVMIGILLALQVNTWNQDRQLQQEEREILQRLLVEFQGNSNQLTVIQEDQIMVGVRLRKLLDAMGSNPKRLAKDSISLYLGMLSYIPKFTPKQGGLSSVINSGKIGLIQNMELNDLLSQWPGMIDEYSYHQEIIYDISKQQVLDVMLDHYPFRDHQVDVGYGSTGPSEFDYDQTKVLSSMAIETLAELKRVDSEIVSNRILELQKVHLRVIELIQEELNE